MALRHTDIARAAGRFQEREHGALFEYTELDPTSDFYGYDKSIGATHLVFVGPWAAPWDRVDRGTRAAIVKKTVAYVAVDEDDNGQPVWEKWDIKGHVEYKHA